MPDTKIFDLLESETGRYHVGNRTRSTALLAWFLETIWRLDPEDVSDAICDGGGDKGIDALEVDVDLQEITVFQSKHRTGARATQGDVDLKSFVGVAPYFRDEAGIDALLASSPNDELRKLIDRLDLRKKLEGKEYSVRLVFVTNAPLDAAGSDYRDSYAGQIPVLDVWDRDRLGGVAHRTKSLAILDEQVTLPLGSGLIRETLGRGTTLAVAMVPATDLVRLPGIDDLSIFDLNVRLSLGKTRINKELAATIKKPEEHSVFPAYHNGLTLLSRGVTVDEDGHEMTLDGVSVVNGCQSLVALHDNRASLTPELRVLVKIVELGESQDLVDSITYRTNNQNAVNTRDLRSTDKTQRHLQAEVQDSYGELLGYAIRNGETLNTPEVIDNTTAAQLTMAVYLGEPWNAIRKVHLFDQEYHRVFGRFLDGHKLFLLHQLDKVVKSRKSALEGGLEASFAAVRFTILYLVAKVVSTFPEGAAFLESPERWLPDELDQVTEVIGELADDVIVTVNFYVSQQEDEALTAGTLFDPKVVFKSKAGVQDLEKDVLKDVRRDTKRDATYGFHIPAVR